MPDGASLAEKLREQRDKFIAFAFAGADLLVEVDSMGVVVFSTGAGEGLYGIKDGDLHGRSLSEFIYPRDRQRFQDALLRLRNTGRLDHTPLAMSGASGAVTRIRMAGIRLPQFPATMHLALSRIPPMAVADEAGESGAADSKGQFVDMVRQRLNEANRVGQDVTMTLLNFSGTPLEGAEPAFAASLLSTLLAALEECSVKGSSAGRLSERSFGLVHGPDTSSAAVRARVRDVVARMVPGGGLSMRVASLDMEDSTLDDDDIGKALDYIVSGFAKDSGTFAIRSLAEGARVAVEDTLVRVRNFRKLVKGDRLTFVFQPIVNLRTGTVLKYETFGRFVNEAGGLFTPAQIIPFATDAGIIGEFDVATTRKVLALMRDSKEISPLAHISINVSGHSLGNPGFYQALFRLFDENRPLLKRLIIEVTDAARIYNMAEARRLLTRIRALGVRVSLDDFGSGGSSFDMLRALPIDYIKIGGTLMQEAREAKGKAVVKALCGLCKDLNVTPIGERVEDSQSLQALAELGIVYAQGHYFGMPASDSARKVRYYTELVKAAGTAGPALAAVG
ncbi:MAG: EAL domain-containing protein [Magnetospirillum sp.]|nr:EAL domain-containing protein [Magnetospirillum sp.]